MTECSLVLVVNLHCCDYHAAIGMAQHTASAEHEEQHRSMEGESDPVPNGRQSIPLPSDSLSQEPQPAVQGSHSVLQSVFTSALDQSGSIWVSCKT